MCAPIPVVALLLMWATCPDVVHTSGEFTMEHVFFALFAQTTGTIG